jgi:hypothetical protein
MAKALPSRSVRHPACANHSAVAEFSKPGIAASWEKRRNEQKATIDWHFSLDDARTRLKRL